MGNYKSDKKNARFFGLKLNYATDSELIEKLMSVENIQGYLKRLIREDLEKNPQEKPREE